MKSLGDVCTIDKCQGVFRNLPYVGLEDIESHSGRFIGSNESQAVKSSTFKFSPGHLLYGRLRPYLNKVMAPDFSGHCSTEIFPIRPTAELAREFLHYWFLREETVSRIDATCTGARMPRANMNAVLRLKVPVPSLAEQQRIAEILRESLEAVATGRGIAEKNLQNARSLFKTYLQSVFTQRGPTWVERPLRELCDIKHGFAFKSEFFTDRGEYVMLTPGNFFESGGYRDRGDKQKYYCGEIPHGYVLQQGDMLIAMTEQAAGLLGSPILVPESNRFLHNQRLGLVTKKPGVPWTNAFFFHIFNTQAVRKAIHDSASGVKVRHTSPARIGEVVVSFPTSISDQRAIVCRLTDLAEQKESLATIYQQKLAALDALKQSLLHRAFTGAL
jgi:type I restriction enzyme, S subunit